MISRYDVKLNNVSLSSIDTRLLILDVQHDAVSMQRKQTRLAHRHGVFSDEIYYEKCSVTIIFQLRIYSLSERQSVIQQISSWARNGGELEVNDRPGQKLVCVCDNYPHANSVKQWLDELSVTFTAYSYPFWQDKVPTTLTLSGMAANGSEMPLNGNADKAYMSVTVTPNSSDALTSLTISVNDSIIVLQNLLVQSSAPLEIAYDSNMILSIKAGNTSYLDKRTADSSDDLIAICGGVNVCSYVADTSVTITFSARGGWL